MDYVKFNGHAIPEPNSFAMEVEDNIVSEIKTMSGKILADVNGWRYKDITLNWGYLREEYLQTLLTQAINEFTFTFIDPVSGEKTINAFRRGKVQTKTRFRDFDNNIMWKDVNVTLCFPDCYK